MELITLPYISLSLFLLVIAFKLGQWSQKTYPHRKLPPSPPARPVIGHLHLLKQPLHRTFHRLSQPLGPIVSLRLGSRLMVVVSSLSAAKECLRNDVILANRPALITGKYFGYNYTTVASSPYGDHWCKLRQLMASEIFSTSRLDTFLSIRREEIQHLLSRLYEKSSSDFSRVEMKSKLSELTFNIIMGMIAGKRYYGQDLENSEEAKEFTELVSQAFAYGGSLNPADYLTVLRWIDFRGSEKSVGRIHKRMDVLLQGLIDELRRQKSRNTIINHLLQLQESQPDNYSDSIIRGLIIDCGHQHLGCDNGMGNVPSHESPKGVEKGKSRNRRSCGSRSHGRRIRSLQTSLPSSYHLRNLPLMSSSTNASTTHGIWRLYHRGLQCTTRHNLVGQCMGHSPRGLGRPNKL